MTLQLLSLGGRQDDPISRWLLAAAIPSVVFGSARSVLGERHVLRRLFTRPNLPMLVRSDDFTAPSATACLSAIVARAGSRGRHASWLVLLVIGLCPWPCAPLA